MWGYAYDETSELAGASLKVVGVQFAKSYSQWVARPEKMYQTQLTNKNKGKFYYVNATALLSQPPFAFTP
jgi:hypothetical protein